MLLVKPAVMATLGVMVPQAVMVNLDTRESVVTLAMLVLLALWAHPVLMALWVPLESTGTVVNLVLLVLSVPPVLLVQEVLVARKVFEVIRESLVRRGPEVFLA